MNHFFGNGGSSRLAAGSRNPDLPYLELAVSLAESSAGAGGFPSGALLVLNGAVIGEGRSSLPLVTDPTAHAEIGSIRVAVARQGAAKIPGSVLYSTLEPCLMCLHAAYWGGVARVVFGARKERLKPVYYEGSGTLTKSVEALSRPLPVKYLPGLEEMILGLVQDWELSRGREKR